MRPDSAEVKVPIGSASGFLVDKGQNMGPGENGETSAIKSTQKGTMIEPVPKSARIG